MSLINSFSLLLPFFFPRRFYLFSVFSSIGPLLLLPLTSTSVDHPIPYSNSLLVARTTGLMVLQTRLSVNLGLDWYESTKVYNYSLV